MKILKVKASVRKSIITYAAFISMLVNIFSPFVAIVPSRLVYAEDEEVIQTEESVESEDTDSTADTDEEESNDNSSESDESDETTSESSDESSSDESEGPEESPGTSESADSENQDESVVTEEPADSPEGEITPEAASDYRPIGDEEVSNELSSDTQQVDQSLNPEQTESGSTDEESNQTKEENKSYDTLSEDTQIVDTTKDDWEVNEDENYSVTKEEVKIGIKYIFPLDEKVTLTFTKLPSSVEDRSTLRIEKVKVSDLDLPENYKTESEYAYDITTDMENGEFEYDLTLPKPEGSEVEIAYIEKDLDEAKNDLSIEDVKKIEKDKVKQEEHEDAIRVEELNHMTIYIVETQGNAPVLSTATINDQVHVDVLSGESIKVTIKVTTSGDGSFDNWGSTEYKIGDASWVCDTAGHYNGDGTYKEDFDIKAPKTIGTYDLTLKAYNGDNCNGGSSEEYIMEDAITVIEVCGYACPVIHYEWETRECPSGFDNISSRHNGYCYKGWNPDWPEDYAPMIVTNHVADVEYEKSQDPTKCHRPSDNNLRDVYGMDNDTKNDFKRQYSEWMNATPIPCPPCSDVDGDGICDHVDNCVNDANPNQEDWNSNGVGDACDPLMCGNGVVNDNEQCDDGNGQDGDGCSSTCQWETAPLYVNKYEDKNGDGDADLGEGPLENWTFEIYDNNSCTGSSITSGVTGVDGIATINGLYVGNTYWVKEIYDSSIWQNTTGNCKSIEILDTETNNRTGFGNQLIVTCGDGLVNGDEACDYGDANGSSACAQDCTWVSVNPMCETGDPSPSEEPFPVLDKVNIGDVADESTHEVSGWSSENIPGNYGGKDDGTYRQIIGENECDDKGREASFTLNAGVDYANKLKIRHLDGMSNLDSFEVYINGNYWGEYKDSQVSSEEWFTLELPLNNLTGEIEVTLKAVDNIWPNCQSYGQVAISWAEIEGYGCPDELKPEYQCNETIYTVNNSSDFSWLDTNNGNVNNIDTLDFGSSASADDPFNDHTYYIKRYDKSYLKYYDHTTESSEDVGSTDITSSFFTKLSFDIYGRLFGLADDHKLYEISTISGHATLLGTVSGINTGGDIVFDETNTLYLIGTDGKLYTVDLGTLVATLVTSTGLSPVTGLAYIEGRFYISQSISSSTASNIYKMNKDGTGLTQLNSKPQTLINDLSSCLPGVSPQCGDGVINQPSEECDGGQGVTKGESFCTSTCKLVPIYDGDHSCPSGYSEVLVDNLVLDSKTSSPVSYSFLGNKFYLLRAFGTYNYDTGNKNKVADPAYGSNDGFSTWRPDIGIWGTNKGVTSIIGDLGNGFGVIEWDNDKNIDEDHTYEKLIQTTDPLDAQFVISDWYKDWYGNSCDNQSCMKDNSGTLNLDVYECVPTSTVRVCKEDHRENPLEGWKMVLRESNPTQSGITVFPKGDVVTSTDLPKGDYVLESMGQYTYRPSTLGAEYSDSGYSKRHPSDGYSGPYAPWINVVDLSNPFKGYLGNMVNNSVTDWGYFTADHKYFRGYEDYTGTFDFRILDDKYKDNSGQLDVNIYKGWVGVTEEDGCYVFDDVPQGDYVIDEALEYGWKNLTGLGIVTVDDQKESFTVVNQIDSPVTIVAHKIMCKSESDLPNWGKLGGPDITSITAQKFVEDSKGRCWFEEGWEFQWGYENALNPSDNSGLTTNTGWNTTPMVTDANGMAKVEINDLGGTKHLWFREVWNNNYIPFTYNASGGHNSNNVTAEMYCHQDVLNYDNWDRIDGVEYGNTYYCVAFNVPNYGTIQGKKYRDVNRNGNFDTREANTSGNPNSLDGWTINLFKSNGDGYDFYKSMVTGDDSTEAGNVSKGQYRFIAEPGDYRICEVQKSGWIQTEPALQNHTELRGISEEIFDNGFSQCYEVSLGPGQRIIGKQFGNIESGRLTISKDNDQDGNTLGIGDVVRYFVTVNAKDGPVDNVQMTDLLPEGFKYVSGSYEMTSSTGRDMYAQMPNDPVYSSPGVWDLGNMDLGEKVQISFLAEVSSGVDAGDYPDLAYARGLNASEETILAQSESSDFSINGGVVNDNFVGTLVAVGSPSIEPDEVDVDEEEEEEIVEEGDVLGASTMELPATGASEFITFGLIIGFLIGLSLILGGLLKLKISKKTLTILLIGVGILGLFRNFDKVYAEEASKLSVRVEKPVDPSTTNFDLSFVSMDILGRSVDIECYVKGPSDADFGVFETMTLKPGGNSGICKVDGSVLVSQGTYSFKVKAMADGDTDESDIVNTTYDSNGPDKPKYIEKDKEGSCKYEITFKTADDGQTSYVEIYRDDDKEIDVDDSSRIKTITVGPAEKKSFDDELYGSECANTPYYAVRAFDSSGNYSDVEAEETVKVVTKTVKSSSTQTSSETTILPLEVLASNVSSEGSEGPVEIVLEGGDESIGSEDNNDNGTVLGEKTQDESVSKKSIFTSIWFWLALIVLILAIINVLRRRSKNK